MSATVLVNRAWYLAQMSSSQKEKRSPGPGDPLRKSRCHLELSGARMFCSFRKNPTSIQCVIDNLTHGGRFGINIHAITCAQMSNNAFCRYLEGDTSELGITSRLNMINLQKPLV